MKTRTCNVCKVDKYLEEFHKCKRFPLGVVYTCKVCAKERSIRWNQENKEKKSSQGKEHYARNKEDYLDRARKSTWAKDNPARVRELSRLRHQKNPEKDNTRTACRRAGRIKATPPWANLHQIGNIYKACAKVSKRTGVKHHVDHIVPLNGTNVCGLHVESNLCILPARLNLAKSNRFDLWYTKDTEENKCLKKQTTTKQCLWTQ